MNYFTVFLFVVGCGSCITLPAEPQNPDQAHSRHCALQPVP
jgi:hypothetical protein